jgi:hypothetical protein
VFDFYLFCLFCFRFSFFPPCFTLSFISQGYDPRISYATFEYAKWPLFAPTFFEKRTYLDKAVPDNVDIIGIWKTVVGIGVDGFPFFWYSCLLSSLFWTRPRQAFSAAARSFNNLLQLELRQAAADPSSKRPHPLDIQNPPTKRPKRCLL